jgi:hypothetical protein
MRTRINASCREMCGSRRVYIVWPSSFPMGNNHSIHVSRTPFPTIRFLVRRLRFWGGPSSLASRWSGLAILGLAWAFLLRGSRDRGCLLSNALTNSIAFSKSSRQCHSSCSLPHPFHRTRYRRSYPPSTKTHSFRTIFSTSHSPLNSSSSSIVGLGSAVGGPLSQGQALILLVYKGPRFSAHLIR